jgi:hypothetical protein
MIPLTVRAYSQVNGYEDRKHFSAKKYAAEHGLGDPIRVEWFLSSAGK